MLIGGPPPVHFAGGGPRWTAFTHMPATHPRPMGHTLPQVPQLELSLWGSTHEWLQSVVVGGHWPTHALLAHTGVAPVHLTPQPPQLFGSMDVGMHLPLQSAW